MKAWLRPVLRRVRQWTRWPPVGSLRFGDLGSTEPVGRDAHGPGTPVPIYYARTFLDRHAADLVGRVLRIEPDGDSTDFPLSAEPHDALVCRGVLERSPDPAAAVERIAQLLEPGGRILAPLAGVGAPPPGEESLWGFTPASARRLFETHFEKVEIESFGNVRAAAAAVHGIAAEELGGDCLEHNDRDYPLLVGVRATRRAVP